MESTGVSSFTFFLPLGCGANLTAFHLETKRLRSLNCGSGDLIFQPLAYWRKSSKAGKAPCCTLWKLWALGTGNGSETCILYGAIISVNSSWAVCLFSRSSCQETKILTKLKESGSARIRCHRDLSYLTDIHLLRTWYLRWSLQDITCFWCKSHSFYQLRCTWKKIFKWSPTWEIRAMLSVWNCLFSHAIHSSHMEQCCPVPHLTRQEHTAKSDGELD